MVRQRKQSGPVKPTVKSVDKHSSSSNCSNITIKRNNVAKSYLGYWKEFIVFIVIFTAATFGYIGYLETRVNTPYDDKRVITQNGLDIPEKFWGTYRPGTYFGLKTRDKQSIVTGLMWYFPRRLKPGGDGIRHWCEQSDNLERYGWLQHDGLNFGVQEILDGPFKLTTSFVKKNSAKHGGDWTARIDVTAMNNVFPNNINLRTNNASGSARKESLQVMRTWIKEDCKIQYNQRDVSNVYLKSGYEAYNNEEVSLIWYVALDEDAKDANIWLSNFETTFTGVKGETSALGQFSIKLTNHSGVTDSESFLITKAPGLSLLREVIVSSLRLVQNKSESKKRVVLAGNLLQDDEITGIIPFSLDVMFESGFQTREETLTGLKYTQLLEKHQIDFDEKFENTFNLRIKGYDVKSIKFAQAALSNLVGGIGYFYGASMVQSSYTNEPVNYWNSALYTAVPSRSFFPRGFLWDEGFHGLLLSKWDLDIELDIIGHWMDLMNAEGWIPREQILGSEALAKVPSEFVVQRNTNANPPTFFITLEYILDNYEHVLTQKQLDLLDRLYPRLQAWFSWFNTTQKGITSGSYRWKGRDSSTQKELNPKTLTSGLDDYPRASHPTEDERHIDLYCWMAVAASTMHRIGSLIGQDISKYEATSKYLRDNKMMDKLHWSSYSQTYADYGLHTDAVTLKRPDIVPRSPNQNREMIRVTLKNPEYRLVDSSFGYVSLFPFLLRILDANSEKLGIILEKIVKPELLWTKYGLRSLSTNSPLYMKRNTEHDPPYWRGAIWINMNYLAVRALHFYSIEVGPFQSKATTIYKELKSNLVENIMKQYLKSGYIWEQYNDKTGEGGGCRPFTGWSALVVNIMSEKY